MFQREQNKCLAPNGVSGSFHEQSHLLVESLRSLWGIAVRWKSTISSSSSLPSLPPKKKQKRGKKTRRQRRNSLSRWARTSEISSVHDDFRWLRLIEFVYIYIYTLRAIVGTNKQKIQGSALAAMTNPADEPKYLEMPLTGGHRLEFLTVQSTNDVWRRRHGAKGLL